MGRAWGQRLALALLLAIFFPLSLVVTAIVFRDALLNSAPVRERIAAELRAQTGRDVTLEGKIRLPGFASAGYPWLRVEVGAGVLGNPKGYEGPPLLRWNSLSFLINLRSLSAEMPSVDALIVNGLQLAAGFDAQGRDNFSDLGPLVETPPPQFEWEIPSVQLVDARIRYVDRESVPAIAFYWDEVDLQFAQLRQGARALSDRWRLRNLSGSGRLTRHPLIETSLASGATLKLTADELAIDLAAGELNIKKLPIELGAARLTMSQLRLGFADEQPLKVSMRIDVEPLATVAWLRTFGVEVPSAMAETDLLQLESFRAQVEAAFDDVTQVSLDDLSARIDATTIKGRLSYAQDIDIKLTADRIDLNRYLLMFDSATAAPRREPEAQLQEALTAMRSLPLNGALRIGQLKVGDNRLDAVKLTFQTNIESTKKQ